MGAKNPILTRFLALIECSEIPAQLTDKNSKYEKKSATGYRLTSWKRVVTEISAQFLYETDPFLHAIYMKRIHFFKSFVVRDL